MLLAYEWIKRSNLHHSVLFDKGGILAGPQTCGSLQTWRECEYPRGTRGCWWQPSQVDLVLTHQLWALDHAAAGGNLQLGVLAKTPLLGLTLWRVNKLNPTFIQCCLLTANKSDFEVKWVRAVLGTLRKDKASSTGSAEQGTFQTHEQQLCSQPALPAAQHFHPELIPWACQV